MTTNEASKTQEISAQTSMIGSIFDGKYLITDVLGKGGYATVYLATQSSIGREVAIKLLDTTGEANPMTDFFQEAKIAAKITHPNVVSIYDFGFAPQTHQPYIVMEVIHGHDLGIEIAQNGPLSPARVHKLFKGVLEALAEGHHLGIIHKDLKPSNLPLTNPGGPRETLRILDFGIAKLNEDPTEPAENDKDAVLLGTPRYLSPEYIEFHTVSPGIDVYQIALIIAEALSGKPAAEGTPYMALMNNCNGNLSICPFLKQERIWSVFSIALCKDPAFRYQDAQEFLDAWCSIEEEFQSTYPLYDKFGNPFQPALKTPQPANSQAQNISKTQKLEFSPISTTTDLNTQTPQDTEPAPYLPPTTPLVPAYDPNFLQPNTNTTEKLNAPTLAHIDSNSINTNAPNTKRLNLVLIGIIIVLVTSITILTIFVFNTEDEDLTPIADSNQNESNLDESNTNDEELENNHPKIQDSDNNTEQEKNTPSDSDNEKDSDSKKDSVKENTDTHENLENDSKPTMVSITFESEPAGAQVVDVDTNDELCEATPCTLSIAPFEQKTVEFLLPDYPTQTLVITPQNDKPISVAFTQKEIQTQPSNSNKTQAKKDSQKNKKRRTRRPI